MGTNFILVVGGIGLIVLWFIGKKFKRMLFDNKDPKKQAEQSPTLSKEEKDFISSYYDEVNY